MATAILTNNEGRFNIIFTELLKNQERGEKLREDRLDLMKIGEVIQANELTQLIRKNEEEFTNLNDQVWSLLDKDEKLYQEYLKYLNFKKEMEEAGKKPYKYYYNN